MGPGSKPESSSKLPKDWCSHWWRWHYHPFWSIFLSFQHMPSSQWSSEPADITRSFCSHFASHRGCRYWKIRSVPEWILSRQWFSKKKITNRHCYLVRPNSQLCLSALRTLSLFSDIVFESSASEGAILIMPQGASSEDLGNLARFREYAAANVADWYRYVNGPVKLRTATYVLLSVLIRLPPGVSQLFPIKHNK